MNPAAGPLMPQEYAALDRFRYQIRRFLHFSEEAARKEGLEPQQHQMVLAIRASEAAPTIGELAEHLLVRHHSAVGLVDRLQEHGWVERFRDTSDRREVRVRLTRQGERKLQSLSVAHREELRKLGPKLVEALRVLLDEIAVNARH